MDVVARGAARLATWDLEQMREFTESRPELRAKLLQIVSADLAAKLRDVTAAASGIAGQQLASGAYSNCA